MVWFLNVHMMTSLSMRCFVKFKAFLTDHGSYQFRFPICSFQISRLTLWGLSFRKQNCRGSCSFPQETGYEADLEMYSVSEVHRRGRL